LEALTSNFRMLALNSWGPSGWHFIHAIMMSSPESMSAQQRDEMKSLLVLLGTHLPCPTCRRHFSEFVVREATEHRLSGRDRLVELMNDCHNEVNRRSNKPEFSIRQHYVWMATGKGHRRPPSDYPLFVAFLFVTLVLCHAMERKIARTRETAR